MQRWLPTTIEVEDAGPDRVHVEGDAGGHHYATNGLFRAEKDQLRMEWGSEGPDYAGWAQVYHEGDDASEVNLHLSFFGKQAGGAPGRRRRPDARGDAGGAPPTRPGSHPPGRLTPSRGGVRSGLGLRVPGRLTRSRAGVRSG